MVAHIPCSYRHGANLEALRAENFYFDGKILAFLTNEDSLNYLEVWDIENKSNLSKKPIEKINLNCQYISSKTCSAINWQHRKVVIGNHNDYTLYIINISSNDKLAKVYKIPRPEYYYHSTCVDISADGNYVICGDAGSYIKIFACKDEEPKQVAQLTGHTNSLCNVKFIENAHGQNTVYLFLSASADGSIKKWVAKDSFQDIRLLWSTPQQNLHIEAVSWQNVQGISDNNYRLLEQRNQESGIKSRIPSLPTGQLMAVNGLVAVSYNAAPLRGRE